MYQVTHITRGNVSTSSQRGFSLIEVTLVIGIMLTIASIVTYSVGTLNEWKKGRSVSEDLKAVYVAQKSYLADHPTSLASDFTEAKLVKYLPGNLTGMPTAESLDDEELTLSYKVIPPVFKLGSSTYDPSGSSSDGLWDVGGL
ncbi:type II secretion system protein [Verrucomicrobiales bacterium BCK34]|nr:type II secretion system protein [Verrucomicrobiales bacterium BCK34]